MLRSATYLKTFSSPSAYSRLRRRTSLQLRTNNAVWCRFFSVEKERVLNTYSAQLYAWTLDIWHSWQWYLPKEAIHAFKVEGSTSAKASQISLMAFSEMFSLCQNCHLSPQRGRDKDRENLLRGGRRSKDGTTRTLAPPSNLLPPFITTHSHPAKMLRLVPVLFIFTDSPTMIFLRVKFELKFGFRGYLEDKTSAP